LIDACKKIRNPKCTKRVYKNSALKCNYAYLKTYNIKINYEARITHEVRMNNGFKEIECL
jgi:hypothetical protein